MTSSPPGPTNGLRRKHLTVDVSAGSTDGGVHDSKTPAGLRGHCDLRSPGAPKTPFGGAAQVGFDAEDPAVDNVEGGEAEEAPLNAEAPMPDFMTQTDRHGNAATPRTAPRTSPSSTEGEAGALLGPDPNREVSGDDPCDTLLESFRTLCCCLLPEENRSRVGDADALPRKALLSATADTAVDDDFPAHPAGYSTRGHDAPPLLEHDSALRNGHLHPRDRVRLLPPRCHEDAGKKCLVLDLDETLVHSSFRAVEGADFVIPVQIEDVVHYVYVAKRPGVDAFLSRMAQHYEIVVYTASLDKYADVLLDLLDPQKLIRTRLFRESCVFHEGNYVKDLSVLNRPLEECIIVDNSPASYLFHPENAVDCSSFIDDVQDRELDRIGEFLEALSKVDDVRGTVTQWKQWPDVDLTQQHRRRIR